MKLPSEDNKKRCTKNLELELSDEIKREYL